MERELRRRVGAGAPDVVEWHDAAEQHASAREWPAVIDRDRRGTDGGVHGIPHAQLLRAAGRRLERREPLAAWTSGSVVSRCTSTWYVDRAPEYASM